MSESIVIYRSEFERQQDQFFANNPEYIVYFMGGALLLVIILWLTGKLK